MSGYLINFCGVVHMPRLGPSCLSYICHACFCILTYTWLEMLARNEVMSRGANQSDQKGYCIRWNGGCGIILYRYSDILRPDHSIYQTLTP